MGDFSDENTAVRQNRNQRKQTLKRAQSVAKLVGKGNQMEDLEDLKTRKQSGHANVEFQLDDDDDDAMTGEQRLFRVTKAQNMAGLIRYTQHTTTRDMRKKGVTADVLQHVVLTDEWQLMSCLALPMTVIFFLVFMVFFQQHYGVSYVHLQESTLRHNFGDAAWDVDNIEGIYDWLEEVYIPYIWSADRTAGQGNYEPRLEGAEFQELIAGVLIRVSQSTSERCDDDLVKEYYFCHPITETNGTGFANQELQKGGAQLNGWMLSDSSRRLQAKGPVERSLQWVSQQWPNSRDRAMSAGHMSERNAEFDDIHVRGIEDNAVRAKSITGSPSQSTVGKMGTHLGRRVQAAEPIAKSVRNSNKRHRKQKSQGRRSRRMGKVSQFGRRLSGMVPNPRKKEQSTAARRLRKTRPEFNDGGWIPFPYVTKDVWEYTFPMSMTEQQAVAVVQRWRQSQIFDRSTLFVGTEVILKNDHIGNGLLSHCFINFLLSRGGHIYVEVTIQSLILSDEVFVVFFAVLWLATLIGNSISTPARACAAWKAGTLKAHFKRFWNAFQWVLIAYGWVIVLGFGMERTGMVLFHEKWDEYTDLRASRTNDLLLFDTEWFRKLHEIVYATGNFDVWLQVLVADFHIVLILRFFVASRGQPRLAIVVNTIRKAAIDLAHLLMVFGIIFFAYVLSGRILFGRRMEEFSTIPGAMAYCVQIVLQREFDWDTLTVQDLWTVLIWTWTFVLLVVIVLVNIVLAMMFDTYADIRNHVHDSDTLLKTTMQIVMQVKHMANWVSNRDLLLALGSMHPTANVTATTLRAQLPGIGHAQIEHLFTSAKNRIETVMTKASKNALPEAVASICIGVDGLRNGVKAMLVPCSAVDVATDFTGEAPEEIPPWVKSNLLPHLEQQEQNLLQMHSDISDVKGSAEKRGIGKNCEEVPLKRPGWPGSEEDADCSETLQPTSVLTGRGRRHCVAKLPPMSNVPECTTGMERIQPTNTNRFVI